MQSRTVPAFKNKLLSGHNASEAPSGHNTKQLTLNTSLNATTETIHNFDNEIHICSSSSCLHAITSTELHTTLNKNKLS